MRLSMNDLGIYAAIDMTKRLSALSVRAESLTKEHSKLKEALMLDMMKESCVRYYMIHDIME